MRLTITQFFLLNLFPFTVASAVNGNKNCKEEEFWWKDKELCLPVGGIPNPPSPPKGYFCPPTGYYWDNKKGHCVPRYSIPENGPEPQCPKNSNWYRALFKCLPISTPTSTFIPKPSGMKDDRKYDLSGNAGQNGHKKRTVHKPRLNFCPDDLEACLVSGHSGEYECLDTTAELKSCGGCVTSGEGRDCTKIQGVWNVGCEEGRCVILTCATGFQLSSDKQSCLPKSRRANGSN